MPLIALMFVIFEIAERLADSCFNLGTSDFKTKFKQFLSHAGAAVMRPVCYMGCQRAPELFAFKALCTGQTAICILLYPIHISVA
jgi:hypothetical protein